MESDRLGPPIRREVETGTDVHHMANMYLARDMISKEKSDSNWAQAYRDREEALKANPKAVRNDTLILLILVCVLLLVFFAIGYIVVH